MQPTAETPQQRAIREVRLRYERGDISFESFQSGLDQLISARDEGECQAILASLPNQTQVALAALEGSSPSVAALSLPAQVAHNQPKRRAMVAIMAEVKRTKRAWRLAANSLCLALMGEVKIDLSLAALPPNAHIQVTAIMGEVVVYVPRTVEVEVRSVVLLGECQALGESNAGVIGFGHEVSDPTPGGVAPESRITIDAFILMGEVRVVPTDGPVSTLKQISRAAKEIGRAFAEGLRTPALPEGGDD